jgi:nucleotide-binding universal stress UspA family protein
VVGVDGSPPSLLALEWAARQAGLTNATLEVVTTWEWQNSIGWTLPFPADYDPATDARKVLDDILEKLYVAHPDLMVRSIVVEGHPSPVLVEASRGADLLVVGNRGHGEFSGMLLGSVSEFCAAHAHCPVLVFREDTIS